MAKIIGNTTATANPQSDWNQIDSAKADYIKNKPQLGVLATQDSETDPTVPSWAKEATKPTYTADEVGALPDSTIIPDALSDLTSDSAHRTVTDAEKAKWDSKSNFSGSYNDLVNVPSTFAPSEHVHDYIPTSQKGVASGVASLDSSGKIPASQLPSYVDDVIEANKKADFPLTGETGKIYVDLATNKTYRWGGSAYVEISASLTIGTTSSTAAAGNHTHSAATTSAAGLMSADDKTKLNGIATGANAYTLPTASSSTLGGVKTTSTVTSTSGLTPCPIISGVPYYKDTNSTYSLSSFGVTATAAELNKLDGVTATTAELNYVDGVTSNIQTQLNNKAVRGEWLRGTSHYTEARSIDDLKSSSDVGFYVGDGYSLIVTYGSAYGYCETCHQIKIVNSFSPQEAPSIYIRQYGPNAWAEWGKVGELPPEVVTVPANAIPDINGIGYKQIGSSFTDVYSNASYIANTDVIGTSFTVTHGEYYKVTFAGASFIGECIDEAYGTSDAGRNMYISDGVHTFYVSYYDNSTKLTGFTGTGSLTVQKALDVTIHKISSDYLPALKAEDVIQAVPCGAGYYSYSDSQVTQVITISDAYADESYHSVTGSLTAGKYYKIIFNGESLYGQAIDITSYDAPSGSKCRVSDGTRVFEINSYDAVYRLSGFSSTTGELKCYESDVAPTIHKISNDFIDIPEGGCGSYESATSDTYSDTYYYMYVPATTSLLHPSNIAIGDKVTLTISRSSGTVSYDCTVSSSSTTYSFNNGNITLALSGSLSSTEVTYNLQGAGTFNNWKYTVTRYHKIDTKFLPASSAPTLYEHVYSFKTNRDEVFTLNWTDKYSTYGSTYATVLSNLVSRCANKFISASGYSYYDSGVITRVNVVSSTGALDVYVVSSASGSSVSNSYDDDSALTLENYSDRALS